VVNELERDELFVVDSRSSAVTGLVVEGLVSEDSIPG